jgi:hypothetical protein
VSADQNSRWPAPHILPSRHTCARDEKQLLLSPSKTGPYKSPSHRDAFKSFRIRSYENCRVSPAISRFRAGTFRPSEVSTCFQLSPFFSYSCALFCTTGAKQLFWNQFVAHSFRPHGGVHPSPFHFRACLLMTENLQPSYCVCRAQFISCRVAGWSRSPGRDHQSQWSRPNPCP